MIIKLIADVKNVDLKKSHLHKRKRWLLSFGKFNLKVFDSNIAGKVLSFLATLKIIFFRQTQMFTRKSVS